MPYAARDLERLGYCYVPGESGDPSDWVLRQAADKQKRFEWKNQADYDEVGDAVVAYIQGQLIALCNLVPLPLPASLGADAHTVVYASENLTQHTGPLLVLVCGAAPGGAAGVWGRSLCINSTLKEGAMFDYIFRAQQLGWAVLVANPTVSDVAGVPVPGSECPHAHLRTLWNAYVEPCAASKVLVVAHSYGASATAHLLKTEASARKRICAVALTDAWANPPGSLLQEVVPEEGAAAPELAAASEAFKALRRLAAIVPAAFAAPSAEFAARLAEVSRNFVASQLPPGEPVAASRGGVPCVSAGHEKHPSTTHAATEVVFEFLSRGLEGGAGSANDELRARCRELNLLE